MTAAITLDEICDRDGGLIQTGPFGSQLHQSDYTDEGVPVVMPKDIVDGRIVLEGIAHIPENKADELSRHRLSANAIVMPRRGDIGKRALITDSQAGYLCGTGCIQVALPPDSINPRYLYYFLAQKQVVEWLERNAVGATMLNLNSKIVGSIRVPSIPIGVQCRIADILVTYDDLIENNRRRIALLEEAAQQVYKEWFIRLRFPGYESTSIVDGIPEGWKRLKLNDVCDSVGGGTPSTKKPEYWTNGDVTWVIPSDITKNDCLILLDSETKITQEGLRGSSAKMVPADTILMTSRASVGFFGLIDREVCTNQGFISVIPKQENYRMYLLHNLMHRVEEIRANAGGTTYKEISKGRFRELPVVLPDDNVLEAFQEYVYGIVNLIRVLKKQKEKLIAARDLLLPRLMSGAIEV